MQRVDLGCGPCKQSGFLGLDRYALPGVDIIADLDGCLPFRDDSVELLVASHSLEHVSHILKTMQEIYRICEHGAQLCIIAPYSEQKLNLANPYHTTVFNEHTPRFWTSWPHVTIDPKEFYHPHATPWGLSRSDHSDPQIDVRLVRLEYFYFPQYVGLSPEEQRQLRRDRVDVCDQILYHLIVWKGDQRSSGKSFDDFVTGFVPYEPEYIRLRRKRDEELMAGLSMRREELTDEVVRHGTLLHELRLDLHQHRTAVAVALEDTLDLRSRLLETKSELATVRAREAAHMAELAMAREVEAEKAEGAAQLKRELAEAKCEASDLRTASDALRVELSGLIQRVATLQTNMTSSDVLKAKLALVQAELQAVESLLAVERMHAESLTVDLAAAKVEAAAATHDAARLNAQWIGARRSLVSLYGEARRLPPAPLIRAGGFYVGREMPSPVASHLAPLRDYSDRHWDTAKASLILSEDLNGISYQEYVVPFDLDTLMSVSLAIRPLVPDSPGTCGVEIVSAGSVVLTQIQLPLTAIHSEQVAEFSLAASVHHLKKNWLLRVFVRDAIAPVPVYELVRTSRRGRQFFPLVLFR